jgi:hypothetical protein
MGAAAVEPHWGERLFIDHIPAAMVWGDLQKLRKKPGRLLSGLAENSFKAN